MPGIVVRPGPIAGLGAEVEGIDFDNLAEEEFQALREALYHHNVIFIRRQSDLSSKAQAELTRRFDLAAFGYGHGRTITLNDPFSIPT